MNDTQRQQIAKLRGKGYGYGRIAQALNISENTIKTYCRRHGLGGVVANDTIVDKEVHYCLCCGKEVVQQIGRKEKKFCSDKCRNKWWNSNLDKVNRKANYEFICPHCKKLFSAYGNKNRKYCSHSTVVVYNNAGIEKAVFYVYNAKATASETTTIVETETSDCCWCGNGYISYK